MEASARKKIPFKGLAVVSAVCRHKSFTAASRELHVTPSAVSKKIADVEAQIGLILFDRQSGAVEPNETALALARAFDQASDMLAAAIDEVRPRDPETTIRVAAPASFAMRWLIPRLWHLSRQHPDIRVDVIPTHAVTPLASVDHDVAIRQAEPDMRPAASVTLFSERLSLLAKPVLLSNTRGRRMPDLSEITLIASDSRPGELDAWISHNCRRVRLSRKRRCFPHFYIALEAALAAEGAVVGPLVTLSDLITRGDLIELLPDHRIAGPEIIAFPSAGQHNRAPVVKFIEWVRKQGAEAARQRTEAPAEAFVRHSGRDRSDMSDTRR